MFSRLRCGWTIWEHDDSGNRGLWQGSDPSHHVQKFNIMQSVHHSDFLLNSFLNAFLATADRIVSMINLSAVGWNVLTMELIKPGFMGRFEMTPRKLRSHDH